MMDEIPAAPAQELILNNARAGYLLQLLAFAAGATLMPLLPGQFLAGPLVNALLFIVTVILGRRSAWVVCFISSPMALIFGLLPAPLAPMVPFIILGNIIMVTGFDYLRLRDFWVGVIVGSALKFLWLYVTSRVIIAFILHGVVAQNVAIMMSWPQLATALLGGVIAFIFLKTIKRI